jgi:hypothetical protein
MICFTLKCGKGHDFDSWFGSGAAFESLKAAGRLTCAVCGSTDVDKAIMAPRVSVGRNDHPLSGPASTAEQAIAELRKHIEAKAEDVGTNFAAEARKIHDGDAPIRPIIGEAKWQEARDLIEDGIPIAPLPWSGSTRKAN